MSCEENGDGAESKVSSTQAEYMRAYFQNLSKEEWPRCGLNHMLERDYWTGKLLVNGGSNQKEPPKNESE